MDVVANTTAVSDYHEKSERGIHGANDTGMSLIKRKTNQRETIGIQALRTVIVHVTYLKFGEINTLTEKFEADVLVRARWREPDLDDNGNSENEEIDLDSYWNPCLFIENAIGDPKVTSAKSMYFDKLGKAWITERKRFRGTYMEQLELWDFPFDVQDLTVFVMSEMPVNQVELKEEPHEIHKLNRHNFIDEQEWYLYKYLESKKLSMAKDPAEPNLKCSVIRVRARAARRPAYFIFNNFIVTFLIVILCFTTFAVKADLPQNRLQLSFTLVLTAIAFKFVVNQSVPKLSYLTYLDRYVLACMIILVAVSIWHGLQILIDYIYKDYICMGVVVACYLIYNIYFWLRIYFGPYKIRRQMKWKEVDYVVKIQETTAKNSKSLKSSHSIMDSFA